MCSRGVKDKDGGYVCEECNLDDRMKDAIGGSGAEQDPGIVLREEESVSDEVPGVVVQDDESGARLPEREPEGSNEEKRASDEIPGGAVLDEEIARSPKRKHEGGDDKAIPARKTRSSVREVDEASRVPERADSPESALSSEPEIEFCICGTPDNNEMVACDGVECARKWFHFECVGMEKKTVPKGRWHCEECLEKKKNKKGKKG